MCTAGWPCDEELSGLKCPQWDVPVKENDPYSFKALVLSGSSCQQTLNTLDHLGALSFPSSSSSLPLPSFFLCLLSL